jgi:hypothetical protein
MKHAVKGKAVLVQARSGPEGSRNLKCPDFMTTAQDGGRLSALRTGHETCRVMIISTAGRVYRAVSVDQP